MNCISHAGFGPADRNAFAPAPRHNAGGQAIAPLSRAEVELAAKLTEALAAADAIGLTGIGIRLDQALIELTGIGIPIRGIADDPTGH